LIYAPMAPHDTAPTAPARRPYSPSRVDNRCVDASWRSPEASRRSGAKGSAVFLEKPDIKPTDDTGADSRDVYARLVLPATPLFRSVGFFSPPESGDNNGRPNFTGRTDGVAAF
jgi:hypothetical protein